MSYAPAAALVIKNCGNSQFFLNGAHLAQRNPLVRVNELIVFAIKSIVFLAKNNGSSFPRNGLNIKRVIALKIVFYIVNNVENLTRELHPLFGIADITKLVFVYITEGFNRFVHTENADSAVLFVEL